MTNRALLDAILANPADDAPRLAYAKWLKANGDLDRAEFITVQCDRAAKNRFDPAQTRLEKKEQSLLKNHKTEWLAELPEWARPGAKFRRGFVAVVGIDLETFANRAAELVKLIPLEGIELSSSGVTAKGLQALATCPQAAQLTELSIWYNDIGDAGLKVLAASPLLKGLKTLRLANSGLTDDGVKALAVSQHFAGLTELNLGGNTITAMGIQAITAAAWKLNTLALDNFSMRGQSMTVLAGWSGLASVSRLSLVAAEVGPDEAKALAATPHVGGMRILELGSNPLTAAGVAALADSPALTGLVEVHLEACSLGDDATAALLRFSRFKGLKRLALVNNNFSEDVRQKLLKQFGDMVQP
jgi:uncharacterized protein (TIGR02996 family)